MNDEPTSSDAGTAPRASAWFATSITRRSESKGRHAARWVKATLVAVFSPFDIVPRGVERYYLKVIRRDTGATIATFEYDDLDDAQRHEASLQDRMATLGPWQFTRDVGISFAAVEDATPVDAAG